MKLTVPMKLTPDLLAEAEGFLAKREGMCSRNAIMREAMAKGFKVMHAEEASSQGKKAETSKQQQPGPVFARPPSFVIPS